MDFGNWIKTVSLEDRQQDVLELVFNHIDRLRMFNFQIPAVSASGWELLCSCFLQLPAPNCVVSIMIGSYYHDTGINRQLLFNHDAPNLQNLQLHRCTIDFTSPILTCLTELYVHDITEVNVVPLALLHSYLPTSITGGYA